MAKSNASSHKLYIVEASVNKLVGNLTSFDLGGSGEIIDLTTKDNDGFRDMLVGLLAFSLNIEGLVDFQPDAAVRNVDDLMTAFRARTSLILLIKNSTSGDTTYQGTAYVTAINISSPMEAGLAFTATLEFKGDLTVGAVS